jgi:hypothetical protein
MLEGFTHFELEPATGQAGIKPFVSCDFLDGHFTSSHVVNKKAAEWQLDVKEKPPKRLCVCAFPRHNVRVNSK